MTAEIFTAWRDELNVEMEAAKQTLAEAIAELSAAEDARDGARQRAQAQRDAFAAVQQPLASALAAKLRGAVDELRDAEGAVARAKGAVANSHRVVADLDEAQAQLRIVVGLHDSAEDPATAEAAVAEAVE